MKIVLVALLVGCSLLGFSQKSINSVQGAAVEEKMPQFPGGNNAFYDYLDENVLLPEGFDAKSFMKENGNQFVPVSVAFTIDVDGSITNVKVIDGEDEMLDEKAKQIVESMPKWEPGYRDGSPVKVQYAIPVRFNLM
ncbi:MAG: energy transducer TonB [Vicingaceae bacterium]|nr:energy transducer TonB [Vicingaceae bacterium]